ncbi:hypothetical protein [Clostridium folliculivorans]|uniref:Lipoprotein n=1 Tax=Clostridium folliculivorans TaxID=2886038 RepID=A0A9W5XY63_9CLOT|nr:hypothetical protein [Clostridium folliculivorans]GKU23226.1 hypothetical protein CFOLD11_00520 [Clostridium folliculivorans]GKU29343.1 hypothetical protein CFB3_14490 [Clostridium folliculivorans]
MNNICKKIFHFILLSSLTILFVGCSNESNIEVQKEIKSPNGIYTAYAYVWENGATTSFQPRVSILTSKSAEKEKKEALLKGANVFSSLRSTTKDIDIKWEDDKNLTIIYSSDDKDTYTKVDIFNGIKIKYEKKAQ